MAATTAIVLLPDWPATTLRDAGVAVRVNDGAAVTVNVTLVVAVSDPDVPVTTTVAFPNVALLAAVNVKVDPLKVAVTPLGRPVAE